MYLFNKYLLRASYLFGIILHTKFIAVIKTDKNPTLSSGILNRRTWKINKQKILQVTSAVNTVSQGYELESVGAVLDLMIRERLSDEMRFEPGPVCQESHP